MSEPLKYLVSIIRLCSFALLIYFLFFCFFVVFQDVRFCPLLLCLIFFCFVLLSSSKMYDFVPLCRLLCFFFFNCQQIPKETSLAFFFSCEKSKKTWGKTGQNWWGGGIHALSNGTVLPHYDCNVYVCSCSLFFFSCIAKKASYMAAWLCVKKLSYQIKFFWIELNWSGVRRATVAPRSHSSLRDILCYFCLHCKVMGEVRVTQRRIARGF